MHINIKQRATPTIAIPQAEKVKRPNLNCSINPCVNGIRNKIVPAKVNRVSTIHNAVVGLLA